MLCLKQKMQSTLLWGVSRGFIPTLSKKFTPPNPPSTMSKGGKIVSREGVRSPLENQHKRVAPKSEQFIFIHHPLSHRFILDHR